MTMTMTTATPTKRTKNPLKGLLLYFLYSAGWRLAIVYLQSIAWGVAFLIFGNIWLHFIFGVNAIASATLLIVTGMGNKEIVWERFQLTMPVRRSDLATSQYLSVGLAPLIGIPIFVLFTWLSSIWHEEIYFTLHSVFISIAPFLSMPLIFAALLFPLASIPALENKQEGFVVLFMAASAAIPQLVMGWAYRMGWSLSIASFMTLGISLLAFIVSYFITRKMYSKLDF